MSPASYTSELAASLAPDALARLERYVRVDTEARREHQGTPSTPGQLELGRLLVDELQALGLTDAALDATAYVMATVPGGADEAPVIGLIAHLDTSPDAPGARRRADRPPRLRRRRDRAAQGGTRLDPARDARAGDKASATTS